MRKVIRTVLDMFVWKDRRINVCLFFFQAGTAVMCAVQKDYGTLLLAFLVSLPYLYAITHE